MTFSFLEIKKYIPFLEFIIFFSLISCQNLNQTKKTIKTDSHKKLMSVVIDSNYFEQQALTNYLKAESAFFESDFPTTLNYLKQARSFAPQSTHFQTKIAELYEKEGFPSLAINEYKKLIKKSSNSKKILEKLTNLYASQQLPKKALEQNNLLLKQTPQSFPLTLKEAILHINQENWKEALKVLKKAENRAVFLTETIQTLLLRAYIFGKQKKTKKSLETIAQIKQLDFPEEKLVLKITDFYQNFDTEMAQLYLESFQQQKGITVATSKALFQKSLATNKWEKARFYVEQLKDLGEMKEPHYFYISMFFIKKKQYNKAIPYLKDLITQKPQNGHYSYLLAMNYEKIKQWPKAIKIYKTVPLHSPYFLIARLQLAQLWQKQGKFKKSFKLLNHLAFNNPVSPQAVLVYAESLWKTGNKKETLNILSKALKYHPKNLDILFLRGSYFIQTGQTELALEDMNQILKTHSNHSEALKLITLLQTENT